METPWILPALIVAGSVCLGAIVAMLLSGRNARLDNRLRDLNKGASGEPALPAPKPMRNLAGAIPKLGSTLVPSNEKERTQLQARLVQAGLYRRQAMAIFLGVKLLLMTGPPALGIALGLAGILPMHKAALGGVCLGIVGMFGPGRWLEYRKGARQLGFRRGLPDALDVIVICVEGGLSLVGALRRVAGDLRTVHPDLAFELDIVQREVQLGQTVGEGLRRLGERIDLEEIRSLAAVIIQSDRFGAGLNKALRVHADTLRLKRQQRAEEMAQKAGTKILFPTLVCIFPAIFVVILGPAAIQVSVNLLDK